MTLRAVDLITEPCSERWDAMDGDGKRRMCARCSKTVVDLSGMTEVEVLAHARPGTCVRLPIDDAGRVRFAAASLLPISRLRARPALVIAAPPIAIAAMAMMIACTPHVRPQAEPEPEVEVEVVTPVVTPREASEPSTTRDDRSGDPDRVSGHTMGAVAGTPRYSRTEVYYEGVRPGLVPCDTLPRHPFGSPANLDSGRALIGEKDLRTADLLARCDP